MLKDHSLALAESLIAEACRHFRMGGEKLRERLRGDGARAAVAWAIRRRSTQSQGWIAGRLDLGRPANVSQTVRRFERKPERELSHLAREGKRTIVVD